MTKASSAPRRTGVCVDARFHAHKAPWEHPERPERLEAIERALDEAGLPSRTTAVAARPATRVELERVHTPAYLDELERTVGQGGSGWLDSDTYFSPHTWTAALLAAGASVELATLVYRGQLDNGAAFVRPPGHHATRDQAMGFCLLNNVAVAAAALRAEGARVAILDWDVHHGNGTESIFDEEPNVLYVSTHEWPQYPGTGPAAYRGNGPGWGSIVNVPLAAGTDGPRYVAAYQARVRPELERFRPDLILISAGFDGHRDDPLGGLKLTEETYDAVLRDLFTLTSRVVAILEGGYHLEALARSSVRLVRTMLGDP